MLESQNVFTIWLKEASPKRDLLHLPERSKTTLGGGCSAMKEEQQGVVPGGNFERTAHWRQSKEIRCTTIKAGPLFEQIFDFFGYELRRFSRNVDFHNSQRFEKPGADDAAGRAANWQTRRQSKYLG